MDNSLTEYNGMPSTITVRGARVHNLKNIDIDIPLGKLVAVAGVSGSGKSSLALGVLYAEGSRRYLEALSAYTRRRMTQAAEAKIDYIENVPAALALHQRPAMPGVRSTFGTMTELSNSLRLMYSRLGSHCCPNGHLIEPTADAARGRQIVCPICGVKFDPPSAESFSFNSDGACPHCTGTGTRQTVDETVLVPDESLSIDEGAVAPWNSLMWSLMTDVCRAMGVRTDVPFSELTEREREIVFHGPAEKKHILYKAKNSNQAGEMDFTYFNAVYTVENALAKVKDEKGMKRVEKFLKQDVCPDCGGTRLNKQARSTLLCGVDLPTATAMTLEEAVRWVQTIPDAMPEILREMAVSVVTQFLNTAKRLLDLGLGYLTLDRASSTLSTGERQRVQLARAVRNQTTGILYVLDEPSIGLHPSNVDGLLAVIHDLIAHGNSVVLVEHDVRVLKAADWLVEMGAGAGEFGGSIVSVGTIAETARNPQSLIGKFLSGEEPVAVRKKAMETLMFENGCISLSTNPLHTVHSLELKIPKGRLVAVTGVSGSGKTTLVLESLVPALQAEINHQPFPKHIKALQADGIKRVNVIDATPIGTNIRSTVATYSGVLDDLRRIFAATSTAKELGKKTGDFSYNTGSLHCPACDGTGQITMDIQFLPDVEIICPDCGGLRYAKEAKKIRYIPKKATADDQGISLPELMACTVEQALDKMSDVKKVRERLQVLCDLGLGYLTLGEATPSLSGGEAQRLKIASEMGKLQEDAVFIFDEPTIGLHPLDIRVLIRVFQSLVDNGATVIVIEHDLDMIANADYVIDMGPGGGEAGGRIIATGTPTEISQNVNSITGQYLVELAERKE
ncbi:excinuclease ABC subunit UvrA [Clostridium transplantifaecale]|uniref:excinuclease ABC subunit UvrA n=1 Tax=Clostridium transplantifaecale TaxID=2479838 RepID=UPI001FAB1F1E|nr:excinuclease ABC subunit UvrA [Clostridium transplantifaecale]